MENEPVGNDSPITNSHVRWFKREQIAMVIEHSYWKWPFIVHLPIKNDGFPWLCWTRGYLCHRSPGAPPCRRRIDAALRPGGAGAGLATASTPGPGVGMGRKNPEWWILVSFYVMEIHFGVTNTTMEIRGDAPKTSRASLVPSSWRAMRTWTPAMPMRTVAKGGWRDEGPTTATLTWKTWEKWRKPFHFPGSLFDCFFLTGFRCSHMQPCSNGFQAIVQNMWGKRLYILFWLGVLVDCRMLLLEG